VRVAFCAYCGKELSDQALSCPNCGHPQKLAAGPAATGGRTDGNAIASLILGIASFLVCPLIPAILAVIFGNKAKHSIANDPSLEGEAMAKAGVILGWVNIGLFALVVTIIVIIAASGGFHVEGTPHIIETFPGIPG
jgi:hypothetical protein